MSMTPKCTNTLVIFPLPVNGELQEAQHWHSSPHDCSVPKSGPMWLSGAVDSESVSQ